MTKVKKSGFEAKVKVPVPKIFLGGGGAKKGGGLRRGF